MVIQEKTSEKKSNSSMMSVEYDDNGLRQRWDGISILSAVWMEDTRGRRSAVSELPAGPHALRS